LDASPSRFEVGGKEKDEGRGRMDEGERLKEKG